MLQVTKMNRSYKELRQLLTFEERFEYLKLGGIVGEETFGRDRYLNQRLYVSPEWRHFRRDIIIRDNGCDLGMTGYDVSGRIIIHHINPLSIEDIRFGRDCIFDPNNVISTSHNTSNAIHYGDTSLLLFLPKERTRGDTALWTRAY